MMQKIPNDIILRLPAINSLDIPKQHFLLEIPWDEKYIRLIPEDFQDFFQFVLPHLHVRTTDVHTAICMSMLDEFIIGSGFTDVNRRVVGLALILHDNGWSQLTQAEIATSLGVTGLKLTDTSMGPKEKHAVLGVQTAARMLDEFSFFPPLASKEKELIVKCVLYHDKPWEIVGQDMPAEIQLLVDLDHIWSFTHENFWQDTMRKDVEPRNYIQNLSDDIDEYFVTDFGKRKAREMLAERQKEVDKLE